MRRRAVPLFAFLALLTAPGGRAGEEYVVPAAARDHWAWKPPARPAAPAVRRSDWPRTPVDAFILAKLEAAGVEPAPPAGREALLRRATFDLLGLPPAPAELDAFLADRAPDAWERAIDRLLASPRHGERWGRHWLDLARFAESNGFEHDEARPDAWRYRDYVIDSFNADTPYDRFIAEQVAGDELFPENAAALIATGFAVLGPDMTDAADQKARRQNTLNDATDTTAFVFLGLTLACARCHDHKFEPIPQADYYRLQAFFTPAAFRNDLPIASAAERAAHERATAEYAELTGPARSAIAALEEPYRQRLRETKLASIADEAQAAHRTPEAQRSPMQKEIVEKTARLLAVSKDELTRALSDADKARRRDLEREVEKFAARQPAPLPVAMGLRDTGGAPPRTFLLERGELSQPGEEVAPGFPAVTAAAVVPAPAPGPPAAAAATGRRAGLARWLVSVQNPLATRVMANRLWARHFGRGIVATPSDLGLRGERPTHPELLDWLAAELPACGWSLKRLHRVLLLSSTYAQSATAAPATASLDPENLLFSRARRLRLEGEAVRDALLAASGRLNLRMGGPGVRPPLPAEAVEGVKTWPASPDPEDHVRRSVYIFARRNLRHPFLEAFDFPDSNLSCPRREQSTTATQALALLNDRDVAAAAAALASRLEREAGTDVERVTLAYRLALGRPPTPREIHMARDFLAGSPPGELCRALFNVNEFVYLD